MSSPTPVRNTLKQKEKGSSANCSIKRSPRKVSAKGDVSGTTRKKRKSTQLPKLGGRSSSLLRNARRDAVFPAKDQHVDDIKDEEDDWVDVEDDGGRGEPLELIELDDAETLIELDIEGRAVEYAIDSSPPNTTLLGDALRQAWADFFGLRFRYHRFE